MTSVRRGGPAQSVIVLGAGLLATALLAAGCSSGGTGLAVGSTAATTTTAAAASHVDLASLPRVGAADWQDDMCAAARQFLGTLKLIVNPDLGNPKDTAGVRTRLIGYLGLARRGLQRLVRGLAAAGVPDIDQGDLLAGDLITQLENLTSIMQRDEARAEATDGHDAQAVVDLLDRTADDFGRIGNVFSGVIGNLTDKYPQAGRILDKEWSKSSECQALDDASEDLSRATDSGSSSASGDRSDSSDRTTTTATPTPTTTKAGTTSSTAVTG
ncbi:MAG TPA: hypothetical protein VHA73_08260 [Acidimicrobiales bacterium]|jgi:hypothetical protein|nr:hypothetical protein [Acidimicrobiales bacterium]